jgi:ribosome-associated protein
MAPSARASNPDSNAPAGLDLARAIVDTLDEHKGEDILLLDLMGICSFTDYFVLCTGSSERSLGALAEEVVRRMKRDRKAQPRAREGKPADGWILLDYGDVIAHLFSEDLRDYYELEEIWREGRVVLKVK